MPGDQVDLLKYDTNIKKASWSRAEIVRCSDHTLELQYVHDTRSQFKIVDDDSN